MRSATILALAAVALATPAAANSERGALSAASNAFAHIDDYRMRIASHETAGTQAQDRVYDVYFKKPSLERIDIVDGPDKGGGVVWLGGAKVRGHHGGILRGIRVTFDLHSSTVASLRGDTVDSATIPAMLADFDPERGRISEGPGPFIGGVASTVVTMDLAHPGADGVTRDVIYLSDQTHLPLRRERFVGSQLVKKEEITDVAINIGLTPNDFPW